MGEVFVLAEHRQGQIRDITFEMLMKGRELAEKTGSLLTAVLFGKDSRERAKTLAEYAGRVLIVEDSRLENFNSVAYQKVLSSLVSERKPLLIMIGHTTFGIDLAPSLAVALNLPLVTDCIDVGFEDGTLAVTRQMYGGKVNVRAVVRKSESYIATIRQAAFASDNPKPMNGEIAEVPSPLSEEITEKRFIEYVLPPAGGVDIIAAEVLVGVGRGVKDASNIPMLEEFARSLGGVLACSRPVVDKGWLPSDRQVGTSGKTVKPKLYIAVGVSGAFQHVLGMKNSDLIIAINKDPKAPIFNFADYGVVDDLFKIIPQLKSRIQQMRAWK